VSDALNEIKVRNTLHLDTFFDWTPCLYLITNTICS